MHTPNETKTNRTALIAGGSGGIGRAVALKLASVGAYVFIGYNTSPDRAVETAALINASGGSAEVVSLDITDTLQVEAVCKSIFDERGSLDILVNAAGMNIESAALGMDDEAWETVVGTNLTGAFRICRTAAKYMLLGRWGRIINISSISGSYGGRGQINYASAKAGLESMTRVVALELGRKGVLANCIAPGVISTEMSARIIGEHGDELLRNIAVRRFGRPEDIADAAAFLASEAASYITGQTLFVDGGMGL